ncbi:MAG: hypothetical protein CR967_04200 [Proteobacteria bacterium]|nr:MAG: hypothetical protein CR967_04200 [Pseudomonadota bacterium]
MINNEEEALELAVSYNSSYGFVSDLLESVLDRLGMETTGTSKQIGKDTKKIIQARKGKGESALDISDLGYRFKDSVLNNDLSNNYYSKAYVGLQMGLYDLDIDYSTKKHEENSLRRTVFDLEYLGNNSVNNVNNDDDFGSYNF